MGRGSVLRNRTHLSDDTAVVEGFKNSAGKVVIRLTVESDKVNPVKGEKDLQVIALSIDEMKYLLEFLGDAVKSAEKLFA
jgi:molybdopterin-guanine dinucleotide biosynthesis protein